MEKQDIRSFTLPALTERLTQEGHPSFRGTQIFSWVHEKRVTSFSEMTNLSLELRQWLEENFVITPLTVARKQRSAVDGTIKYLFALSDGNSIETVQMSYHHGNSLCVSTQVGCRMGCKFCASTLHGKVRNLTAGEILSQVYEAEQESGEKISSLVLMGIGEPLDNFENVIDFLQIVSHPKGKNLGLRHITLSTCGVVDKIKELASYQFPITLSISLHAPNNKKRTNIMPINKKWDIEELLDACTYYFEKTGRRITFEYGLIDGVNDTPEEANELAALLQGRNCHINLIPINPIPGQPFQRSQKQATQKFAELLSKKGFTATVRRELGSDIAAACGQLRHEEME